MAKQGKGSMGLLLAVGAGLAAFSMLRQGQATASTLTSARLTGFEVKGWQGTTLSALAHVEFNNTHVTRSVQLQKLGLDVSYNGTTIGTAHLAAGRVLAANENTTLPIPVTLNVGSILTQLAPKLLLTGKLPTLKSFSLSKVVAWLQDNVGPEELRMKGTAQVNGLVVDFDQPIPLASYLPSAPRPTAEEALPTRRPTVRPGASTSTPVVRQLPARRLPQAAAKALPVVRDTVQLVRQAASTVQAARRARPTTGKPTAGKARQPVKPPTKRAAWDAGLPKVNLPVRRVR